MGTLPGASSKVANLELSAIRGRGGCSFFPVARHVQIVMLGTAIGQPMDQPQTDMEGKDDRLVLGAAATPE
jgi:hypothetical protein